MNLPGARFLGDRVTSVQVPESLRINEAPSLASNGDKDNQGPGERRVACLEVVTAGDSGQASESLGLQHKVPCSGSRLQTLSLNTCLMSSGGKI